MTSTGVAERSRAPAVRFTCMAKDGCRRTREQVVGMKQRGRRLPAAEISGNTSPMSSARGATERTEA